MKTRPPSFAMGSFQATPSSFGPMPNPGSAASPAGAPYPNLAGRNAPFGKSLGLRGLGLLVAVMP